MTVTAKTASPGRSQWIGTASAEHR